MAYHYTLWHFAYIKPGTGGMATRDIELMHTILCVYNVHCVCATGMIAKICPFA